MPARLERPKCWAHVTARTRGQIWDVREGPMPAHGVNIISQAFSPVTNSRAKQCPVHACAISGSVLFEGLGGIRSRRWMRCGPPLWRNGGGNHDDVRPL